MKESKSTVWMGRGQYKKTEPARTASGRATGRDLLITIFAPHDGPASSFSAPEGFRLLYNGCRGEGGDVQSARGGRGVRSPFGQRLGAARVTPHSGLQTDFWDDSKVDGPQALLRFAISYGQMGVPTDNVTDFRPQIASQPSVWGLVLKAHRLVHRSTLGLRVIKKKKKRHAARV